MPDSVVHVREERAAVGIFMIKEVRLEMVEEPQREKMSMSFNCHHKED